MKLTNLVSRPMFSWSTSRLRHFLKFIHVPFTRNGSHAKMTIIPYVKLVKTSEVLLGHKGIFFGKTNYITCFYRYKSIF